MEVNVSESKAKSSTNRSDSKNQLHVVWGSKTSPRIYRSSSDFNSDTLPPSTFVMSIKYEIPSEGHDNIDSYYQERMVSGSVEIETKLAEKLGIVNLVVPSLVGEVHSILDNNVFGRSDYRKKDDVRNIVTSRIVFTIKMDVVSGGLSKLKSRWVSRGFEDLRSHLVCRSYTLSEPSLTMLL